MPVWLSFLSNGSKLTPQFRNIYWIGFAELVLNFRRGACARGQLDWALELLLSGNLREGRIAARGEIGEGWEKASIVESTPPPVFMIVDRLNDHDRAKRRYRCLAA